MHLGSWDVGDNLTFPANTHDPNASPPVATDADSAPTYRVYENETTTPLLTGSMAKLDGGNTTGFYSEQIALSTVNGFEVGKSYTIYIEATIDGNVYTTAHTFQMLAEVNAARIRGNVPNTYIDPSEGMFLQTRPEFLGTTQLKHSGGYIHARNESGNKISEFSQAPLGTAMRGTDNAALASDYTSARAGYLDNLNIGENVAGASVQPDNKPTVDANGVALADNRDGHRLSSPMADGTAQAGSGTTITLAADESSQNQQFRDSLIEIHSGTGAGQSRIITDYNGSTKVATVDEAWITNPDATSKYQIIGGKAELARTTHEGATIPTVASVTNAVTVNETTNSGNSIITDATTFPEPSSVPTWPITLAEALGWQTALARNKRTTTSSADTVRNDADGADIGSATLSDDGTTFTRGEYS